MKAMVCELCGSNEFIKQEGMFICQHCNTKYSTEEAKKLMVEVSGSVTIDNSKKLENYYQLARQAKDNNNSEDAAKYYDLIRQENPDDWEASFYSVYYTTMQCKIGEIPNASYKLRNSIDSVIVKVKNDDMNDAKKTIALCDIGSKCKDITLMLYTGVWKQYQPSGYYNNPKYFAQKTIDVLGIITTLGDSIEKHFGNDKLYESIILEIRKCDIITRVDQLRRCGETQYDQITSLLIKKVKEKDTTYTEPIIAPAKSGGCYVATAVYGSYDCPQVWTLRRYRDDMLAKTWYGRAFIHTYYAISPTLVKRFGNTAWFKNMWKPKLDRMVSNLNAEGVEDTPYEDKNW